MKLLTSSSQETGDHIGLVLCTLVLW